jgi:uncharacterized protein (TIGR00255 family)
MIQSMTGFARVDGDCGPNVFTIELRSVNQRHLDINTRLPEALLPVEIALRNKVKERVHRGKIDLTVRLFDDHNASQRLSVNEDKLTGILEALDYIQGKGQMQLAHPSTLDLMKLDGILAKSVVDPEALQNAVITALSDALSSLIESRSTEGQALEGIVLARVQDIENQLHHIRTVFPAARSQYEDRLKAKFTELAVEIDEQRLAQEFILFAQKSDIDEELDRLGVHLTEVQKILQRSGPCGRKLDFLMQELNREANTIGSKSIHTDITKACVEIKVLIEQMREQIQNIE